MRRNILITGASSGLSAEMARQFAEAEKKAYVPPWPWVPMARFLRYAPLPLLKRMV